MDECWADDYEGSKCRMGGGWHMGGAPKLMLAPGATNPRYATAVETAHLTMYGPTAEQVKRNKQTNMAEQ